MAVTVAKTREPVQAGRRERKKTQTRDSLLAAARKLFDEQGYAATTVQQIAGEADVSERTFFRYFDAKEELLLPELESVFAAVEAAIQQRPLDEPPLTAIREALLSGLRAAAFGGSAFLEQGVDAGNPAVASRLVKAFVDWEEQLAAVLFDRFVASGAMLPEAELRLHAATVANAAAAAMRAAMRAFRTRRAAEKLAPAALLDLMRIAFGVLESGCAAPKQGAAHER